jgi:transcriptional regulator with XRE-family HTH domain
MNFSLIAQAVQFHRKKAGLSRNELAVLAAVGKTVVFDIEHGKDTIQCASLLKILDTLNIQLDIHSPFTVEFKQNLMIENEKSTR